MSRQPRIRAELEAAERSCNYYFRLVGQHMGSTAHNHFVEKSYRHCMSRRRFFLRDLLKVQLKEFDYD